VANTHAELQQKKLQLEKDHNAESSGAVIEPKPESRGLSHIAFSLWGTPPSPVSSDDFTVKFTADSPEGEEDSELESVGAITSSKQ
jgi:hypothetical protein